MELLGNGNINIKDCNMPQFKKSSIISFNTNYDDNGKPHDYGYEIYLPNVTIDGLIIDDTHVDNSYTEFYIFDNNKEKTGISNGDLRNNYILPNDINIKDYKTSTGRKIKLFSHKFYNVLEDLKVNFSVPLKDKNSIKIQETSGKEIEKNAIINQNIVIYKNEYEGIKTILTINDIEIKNKQLELNEEGCYKIKVIYQNKDNQEEQLANITIDKTAPVIVGLEPNATYKYKVIPQIIEEHLENIELIENGNVRKDYMIGSEIREEGMYQIVATDKAQNITSVTFKIVGLEEQDYIIENNIIKNVNCGTTVDTFFNKLNGEIEGRIYRKDNVLTKDDKLATGDILETNSKEKLNIVITGDVNGDASVNIKDIIELRKYLLLKNNLSNLAIIAADTNLDRNEINIKDLVKMRIIVLSKEL